MSLLRTAALVAALAVPAVAPLKADAQILRRARERAAEAAARAAERAVDRAANAATERVTGRATQAAGEAAAGALGEAGLPTGGGSGQTVDFRVLVGLFPASAGGLSRGEASGSRSAAMGMETAEAHADYAGSGATGTLTITDTGTMRGFAALGFAWMNGMAVDNESSDGFERSVRIGEHPGYIEESRSGGSVSGEATVVVGERFVVKASVDGGGARAAQALVEGVDLGRLVTLAGPRVTAVEASALRGLLPASVGAGARTSSEASNTSALGMTMAQAEATYGTGAAAVTITVTDYMGAAAIAAFAWVAGSYDRQSDTGFERTGRIDGHPSVESETRADGSVSSEAQVVVGRRFLVSASGNVPFATVREALGRVDLGALARLAE